jgi:nitrogenase subunit NifH
LNKQANNPILGGCYINNQHIHNMKPSQKELNDFREISTKILDQLFEDIKQKRLSKLQNLRMKKINTILKK